MKRFLRITASAALVVLFAACARHKIIPDDKLAQIFHDAFLTNAYIGNGNVRTDSLRIYEPIFARYGYTTDDVHYTIGNFSKRKSARLGDIVERAIEMLEREGKFYNREVAVLDTIDNVARRTFHPGRACRLADPRAVAGRYGAAEFHAATSSRATTSFRSNTSSIRSTATTRGSKAPSGSNAATAPARESIPRPCGATARRLSRAVSPSIRRTAACASTS